MSAPEPISLLDFPHAPSRVVCLVPSLTESMIDLGLGETLVGVTDYCQVIEPIASKVSRLGGILSSDVEAIQSLNPDLVIVDREENSRETIESLLDAQLRIWQTFPRSVEDAIKILWQIVRVFKVEDQSGERIRLIENTLDWVSRAAWSQAGDHVRAGLSP